MASHGGTTTDHDEIRRWAEARGAKPARVINTGGDPEENPGIIRLDFTGHGGQSAGALEEITWDEWFQGFEDSQLAFVHQDETKEGEQSNFNRLIGRETVGQREHGDSHASRREEERAGRASPIRGRNAGARTGAGKPPSKTARTATAESGTKRTAKRAAKSASKSATKSGARSGTSTATTKRPAKKAATKKVAAKTGAATKRAAKNAAGKKTTAKKTAARTSPAKSAAKRTSAKKAVTKTAATKNSAAKRGTSPARGRGR